MILLCDEDIGTRVPRALHLVGLKTISLVQQGWMSLPDIDWLTMAGEKGWLVFSNNIRMLRTKAEKEAIIQNNVGIVFLTSGDEYIRRVLWLLLIKWRWLERIDECDQRPFAYFLSPTGRVSTKYKDLTLLE